MNGPSNHATSSQADWPYDYFRFYFGPAPDWLVEHWASQYLLGVGDLPADMCSTPGAAPQYSSSTVTVPGGLTGTVRQIPCDAGMYNFRTQEESFRQNKDQLILSAFTASYGQNPEFGWMHGSYIGSTATNGFDWNGKQPVGFMAYYDETTIIVGHINNQPNDMDSWSSIGSSHLKMVLITESGTTVPGSAGNFHYTTGTLADYMDGTVETFRQRYDARNNQADGTYVFTAGADFSSLLDQYFPYALENAFKGSHILATCGEYYEETFRYVRFHQTFRSSGSYMYDNFYTTWENMQKDFQSGEQYNANLAQSWMTSNRANEIEISEITFFDADGNELIGAGAHGISDANGNLVAWPSHQSKLPSATDGSYTGSGLITYNQSHANPSALCIDLGENSTFSKIKLYNRQTDNARDQYSLQGLEVYFSNDPNLMGQSNHITLVDTSKKYANEDVTRWSGGGATVECGAYYYPGIESMQKLTWQITNATTVTKNLVAETLQVYGDYQTFTLFHADPSASDFLTKTYTIKWTSPLPGASASDSSGYSYQNHHEGFFLDYNGGVVYPPATVTRTPTQDVLLSGPTWWWYAELYNLFTEQQFSTNNQDNTNSHLTNSNTNSIGNIHHIVGLNPANARYEGLDYWALDSSDGTVILGAMDNSYVRMVKIDINGNTISNPITNRYNSDLSTISSQADLVERWTNGTSQPSSGYYIFEKSSNFYSILTNNFTTISVQAPYENWASSYPSGFSGTPPSRIDFTGPGLWFSSGGTTPYYWGSEDVTSSFVRYTLFLKSNNSYVNANRVHGATFEINGSNQLILNVNDTSHTGGNASLNPDSFRINGGATVYSTPTAVNAGDTINLMLEGTDSATFVVPLELNNGSVVNASRDYRTSFTATVQFTSDNTWTYTTDVSGTMETYTYTTSYNFSSKNSIDFMYHMINSSGDYSYEMLGNLIPGTTFSNEEILLLDYTAFKDQSFRKIKLVRTLNVDNDGTSTGSNRDLNIAEMEVWMDVAGTYTNVVRTTDVGTWTASLSQQYHTYSASNHIDGNRTNFSHTGALPLPWAMIETTQDITLEDVIAVMIFNRPNYQRRFYGLTVQFLDSNDNIVASLEANQDVQVNGTGINHLKLAHGAGPGTSAHDLEVTYAYSDVDTNGVTRVNPFSRQATTFDKAEAFEYPIAFIENFPEYTLDTTKCSAPDCIPGTIDFYRQGMDMDSGPDYSTQLVTAKRYLRLQFDSQSAGSDYIFGNVADPPTDYILSYPETLSGNGADGVDMTGKYSYETLGSLIPDTTFSDGDDAEILVLDYTAFKDQSFRKIKLLRTLNVDNDGTSTGNNTELNIAEMEVWMRVPAPPVSSSYTIQQTDMPNTPGAKFKCNTHPSLSRVDVSSLGTTMNDGLSFFLWVSIPAGDPNGCTATSTRNRNIFDLGGGNNNTTEPLCNHGNANNCLFKFYASNDSGSNANKIFARSNQNNSTWGAQKQDEMSVKVTDLTAGSNYVFHFSNGPDYGWSWALYEFDEATDSVTKLSSTGFSDAATNRITEADDFYIAINDTNDSTYETDTNTDDWSDGMNFTYHSVDVVKGETHEDDVANSIKSLYFQNYTDNSGATVLKNVVQSTDVGTWTASLSTTHTLSGWDFSASQHIDGNRDAPGTSGGAASFSHTADGETYPWAMIETTQDITLEDVLAVMIFNRPNVQKRFYGLTVQFLDSSDNIVASLEANQDEQVNGTGINHLKLGYRADDLWVTAPGESESESESLPTIQPVIVPPALRKTASELPTPGNHEQYILDRTGSECDGKSITMICKAKIPDGYTHFYGGAVHSVNMMAFLWTLRPNPDPQPAWGGGKYTMHEWGGPSSGDANAYRHLARKERMDGWGGGTNIIDYLTLGTSNKEYTFIFRAGDSSHGNASYGCYIYDGTTLVDSFETNAVLLDATSYTLNFNMWNEYPGGPQKTNSTYNPWYHGLDYEYLRLDVYLDYLSNAEILNYLTTGEYYVDQSDTCAIAGGGVGGGGGGDVLEPRTFLADVNLGLDETQEYPEYIISSGSFTESGETGFALRVATGYDESYEKGQLGIRINGIDAWAENADMLVQEDTTTVIGVSYENDKVHFLKRDTSVGLWSVETVTLDSVLDPVDTENIIIGGIPFVEVGDLEAHLSVADGNVAGVTIASSSKWNNNWSVHNAISGTLATCHNTGGCGGAAHCGGASNSNGCCWLTANGTYKNNTGNYLGNKSTAGVLGEYATFTFPEPKRINQITYYISGWWNRYPMPRNMSLLGSDDASTWTLLDSWTNIEYSSVITSSCSNVCNHARWSEPTTLTTDSVDSYKYFRLVIQKTCGNSGPPYGCGGGNTGLQAVIFNQIELYGLGEPAAGVGHGNPLAAGSSIANLRMFDYAINSAETFYVAPVKEPKLRISNISFEDRDGNIVSPSSIFTYPAYVPPPSPGLVFEYDATGTTFNGSTTIDLSSQFDVSAAGILGNADRTLIMTINIQPGSPNYSSDWIYFICGYGKVAGHQLFGVSLSTVHHNPPANKFSFGVIAQGNDKFSDELFIDSNVTTTIAFSYQGSNNTLYLFLKDPSSGAWAMDSVQMAAALNTTLDSSHEDFLLGNCPNKPGFAYNGTVGELKIYNQAFTDTDSLDAAFDPPVDSNAPLYPASNMTDGDASTYFETPLSTPQNPVAIVVDLGSITMANFKFGTDNLGELGTGSSMIWTDISYWTLDESDDNIIVASFHSTYYSYIKVTLDGTYVENSGKYEYTAASGQNNGVAPDAYTSQSQLVSDYNGAVDVVGSPRDFRKNDNFDSKINSLLRPIAVNKMIINNADDSDVGRIEALQYTRLVATDDDSVKADSNLIKLPTIGWNPAGLVEVASSPAQSSISAAITYGEDILPGVQQMLRCNGTTGKEMSQSYSLITASAGQRLNDGASFFLKVKVPAGDPNNCLIEYDSNIHPATHRILFSLERQCNSNSGSQGELVYARISNDTIFFKVAKEQSTFPDNPSGRVDIENSYLNLEEEKDYVYVYTTGASYGSALRCYDVSSGTPTVLFEGIMNGYITWTGNFYVGINGTNQRYHADSPSSWGHMNYDYKQFDIVWQEMSDTEIVSYLAANYVSLGESDVVSTSLHTDVLAEEGTYANLSVGLLSEALADASVVRFNDLTNTERFEVSFRNWAELDNSPTTISLDPGLEGDVLAVSCAEGFTLDGQADGPTSFNLTCELRNGVLQWVQDHSACYFIGTELPTYEIDFSAYTDKTVEFAQADLTANFPSLSPQFLVGPTSAPTIIPISAGPWGGAGNTYDLDESNSTSSIKRYFLSNNGVSQGENLGISFNISGNTITLDVNDSIGGTERPSYYKNGDTTVSSGTGTVSGGDVIELWGFSTSVSNYMNLAEITVPNFIQVQATNSNSNFQHHLNVSAYTPDAGGINFWDYEATDPAAAIGTFKLTADAIGKFTIVYGCLWNNNESVQIYVNGFLHSETTSTSATVTINVSKNDVIEIQESQAVIALYSITFVQQ